MVRPAPAASRAVEILYYLTAHPRRAFTLSELVRALGINVASAHAILAVLTDTGLVIRDPVHKTYVLGPALAAVGFAALDQHPSVNVAIAEADRLAGELSLDVYVTAHAGHDVIFLAHRGGHLTGWHSGDPGYPGDRALLRAPWGAVFVAWADNDTIERWIGPSSPDTAERYRHVLGEIRRNGFSVATSAMLAPRIVGALITIRDAPTDAEAQASLTATLYDTAGQPFLLDEVAPDATVHPASIIAPIFDPAGSVLLSLSAAGFHEPVTLSQLHQLGERVRKSAESVTRRTRGVVPSSDARDVHPLC